MADVTIRMDAKGVRSLQDALDKASRKTTTLGNKGKKAGKQFTKGFRGAKSAIAALGVGLGAAAFVGAAKKTLAFNEALGQLQIDGKLSADQINKLNENLLKSSKTYGIAKEELSQMARVMQDAGGNLDKIDFDKFAKFAVSSKTSAKNVGAMAAALLNAGVAEGEIADSLAGIKAFGDVAQIAIPDFAKKIPEVLASMKTLGITGKDAALNVVAGFQTMAVAFGGGREGASRSATAMKALSAAMQANRQKMAKGIFKGGKLAVPFEQAMASILKQTDGDFKKIQEMLGSADVAQTVIAFKADKGVGLSAAAKEIAATKADVRQTKKDWGDLQKNPLSKPAIAAKKLRADIDVATHKLATVATEAIAESPLLAALATAGGVGGVMLAKMGIQKVFVTNPAGMGKGIAGKLAGLFKAKRFSGPIAPSGLGKAAGLGKAGGVGALAKGLGKAGLVGAVFAATYALGTLADRTFGLSDKWSDAVLDFTTGGKKGLAQRSRARGKVADVQTLVSEAKNLVTMRRKGVKRFEMTRGAGKVALTKENIMAKFMAGIEKRGIGGEEKAKLVAALQGVTSVLNNPPAITVSVAPGIGGIMAAIRGEHRTTKVA